MPLCISLSTFPVHACMHYIVYFPCACLYALHCLLSLCMPLCISLSNALCMHRGTSLCTCPMQASMYFAVYFPCACLYAFSCLLSLCMRLQFFAMHASMHFTVHFSHAVELCRTQRLYWRNLSECFREKVQGQSRQGVVRNRNECQSK